MKKRTVLLIVSFVLASVVLAFCSGMLYEQSKYAYATGEMTSERAITILSFAADQHQFFVDNPDVIQGYPRYGSEGWHQMWVDNYKAIIGYMNSQGK